MSGHSSLVTSHCHCPYTTYHWDLAVALERLIPGRDLDEGEAVWFWVLCCACWYCCWTKWCWCCSVMCVMTVWWLSCWIHQQIFQNSSWWWAEWGRLRWELTMMPSDLSSYAQLSWLSHLLWIKVSLSFWHLWCRSTKQRSESQIKMIYGTYTHLPTLLPDLCMLLTQKHHVKIAIYLWADGSSICLFADLNMLVASCL